tara:strand:- start:6995 stop:8236 length:1242 start_codon:yes stop_codon:yes gene_type:complete
VISQIVKNISKLSIGTILGQFAVVLGSVFLARIYSPEHFGDYGLILTIASIAAMCGALSMEHAVVKEKDLKTSNNLIQISLFISVAIFFLLLALVALFKYFNFYQIRYLNSVPLLFILLTLSNIFYAALNRHENYNELSIIQASRQIFLVLLQISFGILGYLSFGLVGGLIFSLIILVCILIVVTRKLKIFKSFLNFGEYRKLISTNKKFILYSTPQSLINITATQLPIFIFASFFNPIILGSYFFAYKLVSMPAALIGQNIKRVYFRKASELASDFHNQLSIFRTVFGSIALLSILLIALFFPVVENLFILIFGQEWAMASSFCKWMLIWFGANFCIAPCRSLYLVYNVQQFLFFHDLISAIIRTVVLIYSAINFDAITAIMIFSITSAILSLTHLVAWWLILESKAKKNVQ